MTITSEYRAILLGVAGSLALHLVVFATVAVKLSLEPERQAAEIEPAVMMMFADSVMPAEPEPVKPPDSQQFIRTSQNTESAAAPEKASFISDRNTIASAKSAPSPNSTAPVPTTSGVNLPTMDLANREYKDGQPKNDSAFNSPPQPLEKQSPAKNEDTPPKLAAKDPEERLPLEISKPGAIADESPMLKAPVEDEPLPKAIPVAATAVKPVASTARPEKDAYQPQTRIAEMRGSISDRGTEDAVNAAMTIEGRYMAEIQKAVGVNWHKYVRPRRDLAKPGIFAVSFLVNPDGSVKFEDINVLPSDKGNIALESVAMKAIHDAKIPPIPSELRRSLVKNQFSATINFLIGL